MTIQEATESLVKHLNDEEAFYVRHDGTSIIVTVNWIYRLPEVQKLNGVWEGFPVTMGRVSCW